MKKKNKTLTVYTLDITSYLLFCEVCKKLNIKSEKKRLQVLNVFGKLGYLKNIMQTKRSKEQYIKDVAKHYGDTLVINSTTKKKKKRRQ